jgi:hypothetical protein
VSCGVATRGEVNVASRHGIKQGRVRKEREVSRKERKESREERTERLKF